ncbi:MAG: helix-turn-helix domain-containing protein [Myxococcales bacterium]|nr:helix-turn-helix domain-containing protein [Myxococcales bacterium]
MQQVREAIRRSKNAARSSDPDATGPCIWAIGGGKGGVGKSVITSSIAISMARSGERTVVIDADLGGANLHTVLGMGHPKRTLAHFLNNEYAELSEVMCPGPVPNLSLISGAQALYEMANPKYARMRKLLRHIRRLPVDHVFLDLGAGSAFNVLDFFLAAHRGILVVVPEPTSIENTYHFMKAAFFRGLRTAARDCEVRQSVNQVLSERVSRGMRSPSDLVDAIRGIDEHAAKRIEAQANAFTPMLIVNQARTVEHRRIGHDIAIACREYLGTELEFVGALERDECVRVAVSKSKPVVELFPRCDFSRDLSALVDRLRKDQVLDTGDLDDRDCTIRTGRSLYGDSPLATHGLMPDETRRKSTRKIDTSYIRTAEKAERAVQALPSMPKPEAPRGPLPPLDLEVPGATLRAHREHLGWTIEEVARRTRILCLEGIENESFDSVPPEPYIRGFVANYAQELRVSDPNAIAAAFVRRYRLATASRPAERKRSLG